MDKIQKIKVIMLLILLFFTLTSCIGTNKDKDLDVINTNNQQVLVNQLKITEHENMYDIFYKDNQLYVLRNYGMEIYENNSSIDKISFENFKSQNHIPHVFYLYDNKIYVVFENENKIIQLKSFDLNGKLINEYDLNLGDYFHVDGVIIKDNVVFLLMKGALNSKDLIVYELKNGVSKIIEKNVSCITNYDEKQIAYYTVSDRCFKIYNVKKQKTDEFTTNFPQEIKGIEYSKKEDCFYILSLNYNYFYALAKIDIKQDTFNWLNVISKYDQQLDKTQKIIIENDNLYLKSDKDNLYEINNINGKWENQPEPISILYLYSPESGNMAYYTFIRSYGEAVLNLYKDKNYSYIDIIIDEKIIDIYENSFMPEEIDLENLLKRDYDLVLFDDNLTMAVKDYSVLYDLSKDNEINQMFDEMLEGVKRMCTVDEILTGVPIILSTRGFSVNKVKLKMNQIELPAYNWTLKDYYELSKMIPEGENQNSLYVNQSDLYYLYNAILCNILEDNIPTQEEYEELLDVFSNITNEGLWGEELTEEGIEIAFNNVSISTYWQKSITRIFYPRFSENAKIPLRMDVLGVSKNSVSKSWVMDFLRAFIDEETSYGAHDGTNLSGISTNETLYLPIWYKSEELWEDNPLLLQLEYLLENSIHQYEHDSHVVEELLEEFADGIINKSDALIKMEQWKEKDNLIPFEEHQHEH